MYLNEPGLYYLIIKSRLKSADHFQIYVYSEPLPGILKIIQRNYENEINNKDNKIDALILQNKNIIHCLESIKISQEKTRTENVIFQEQLFDVQEDLQKTNYLLDQTNTKLDKALINRNINPNDKELYHQYIFI